MNDDWKFEDLFKQSVKDKWTEEYMQDVYYNLPGTSKEMSAAKVAKMKIEEELRERERQRHREREAKKDALYERSKVEERLRREHPGLQELWEQYQAVLRLVDTK